MKYIHQETDWPHFRWSDEALSARLAGVRHRQGRLIGRMGALGFPAREEATLATLTEDVLKSSEIEGERLDAAQVRSSIARRMGMEIGGLVPSGRDVEGVVEMMLDATQRFREPLTADRVRGWQASLFPTGWSGLRRIVVGGWRDDTAGPMQVVSGPVGRERVQFEAPAADRLDGEMAAFLAWFERDVGIDPVMKAAIAHLWFVTIHPFEDGNGRIARAIADMSLARSEESAQRFYSMSSQIRIERSAYYTMLETTQKGGLDITPWLVWFLECLDRAFDGAERTLGSVLRKARFWDEIRNHPVTERQRLILNRILDGFDGKLTSSKWAKLAGCSHDTASRDIDDLVKRGILLKSAAGGRSTNYTLAEIL
ncbi:MAG: Fic family protein [Blastocatellia bacterium]|nr:Fic family protein [Blastocatellia bacterium]